MEIFPLPLHSTIQYLGFGLSGSSSATSMFQADATIAWVDGNGMAQAQDYYLSNYVQVNPVPILVDFYIPRMYVMQKRRYRNSMQIRYAGIGVVCSNPSSILHSTT